jgi:hypothetical protein
MRERANRLLSRKTVARARVCLFVCLLVFPYQGFEQVRKRLMMGLSEEAFKYAVAKGSSDSALCFALFLSQLTRFDEPLSPSDLLAKIE